MYWPKKIDDSEEKSNDNSTVQLFRQGAFNVLSTGDVEDPNIGKTFLGKIMNNELDVLIIPHHGSEQGCVDKNFLEKTQPHCVICSSNYDNKFDHPAENLRKLLSDLKIPLMTTKNGDIIIKSLYPHDGEYEVINLKANSEEVLSRKKLVAKKKTLLQMNKDTLRNRMKKKPFRGPNK